MPPLAILVLGVIAVIVLIVRLKLNAFVALIASAVLVGVLAPSLSLADVMKETAQHFGRVAGSIGIAIAMAAVVGECLMESGSADRIVRRCVAAFGEKRSSLSLVAAGYVLSVPVFFDTVFYLLVPLARSMSIRTGRHYALNVLAISAGASATHVLVPPTPGPLVMASTLKVDLGTVILVGLAVAGPASLIAWLYAVWVDRRLGIAIREAPGLSLAELRQVASKPESELPGFWISLVPIVLPVALITSSTVANVVDKTSSLARAASFWGDPNLSLMLSAAVSLWILGRHTGRRLPELAHTVETAIKSAGVIILITAAGGAFGGMLVKAG
ncbi:MAG TPA: GntP family permease, partial [Vicinamibacteria bacterium]|nr:GntP family permease [Vicinamibacteria bacterium]